MDAVGSHWSSLQTTQGDPITTLAAEFKADTHPDKVGLSQGAYRDDAGEPFVLRAVARAKSLMAQEPADHEYPGVEGVPEFIILAPRFVLGDDCAALQQGRVASVQALSGTGALRVAAEALMHLSSHADKTIWLPRPSWGNHAHIFSTVGLAVRYYRYLDASGTRLDWRGLLDDLSVLVPRGSAVLMHAAAHNPSGVDPSKVQWDQLAAVCAARQLTPIMDTAYQGFASGNPHHDAYSVRCMVAADTSPLVCQSFSKNMGLYGERVGCFSAVCGSSDEAERLTASLKQRVLRPLWSFPPVYGARVAARVLGDPHLRALWEEDLIKMASRIAAMRRELFHALGKLGTPSPTGTWEHIVDQIGMFTFTGLTATDVQRLRAEHHIYLTPDGRMAMCGLRSSTVERVARAMDAVLRHRLLTQARL